MRSPRTWIASRKKMVEDRLVRLVADCVNRDQQSGPVRAKDVVEHFARPPARFKASELAKHMCPSSARR
jgi:hypothetical protein